MANKPGFVVQNLYALLSVGVAGDPRLPEGEEGIPMVYWSGGLIPIVYSDRIPLARIDRIIQNVIASNQLPNAKLVEFSVRRVVKVYKP
jgi:hypothetical protein